ncbi:MAG TPA: amidohydrolase family protein [Gemmatimonadaceae bacterium]|nr:amidohydrolase family protein [Gemmatimonadaceae bacterium]
MPKIRATARILIIAGAVVTAGCQKSIPAPMPAARTTDAPSVTLINGKWFDGTRFLEKTMYMSRGVFAAAPSGKPDSVIDLRGGYVVPPFAEAHNHNFDASSPETAKAVVARYMKDGVFYGQNPCSVLRARRGLTGYINVPTGTDVTFSNACVTGPGGHPIGLFLRNLSRGGMLVTDTNSTEGFIWIIANENDLARKWPAILAGKPDFIKVLLQYSDGYEKRQSDTSTFDWRGIDPKLVPEIVRRAHAAGLRVMAHVETAADFRTALEAGADQIGHMPGFRGNQQTKLPLTEPYEISDADAQRAARQGTYVVTTLSGITGLSASGPDSVTRRRADSLFIRNLGMLKKRGVRVIVGSDSYRNTAVPEAMYLAALGVYTNAELLRLWSDETARGIFPDRRIGKLEPGYEASFLMLDRDPLADFANVKSIRLRVKQGNTIPDAVP